MWCRQGRGGRGRGQKTGQWESEGGEDSPGGERMTPMHFLVFAKMDTICAKNGELGEREDGIAVSNIRWYKD